MSRFHQIVHKHFPLAQIAGDGPWALISLCAPVAKASLFDLPSARDSTAVLWASHGCGAQPCTGKHCAKTIRLQAPVPALHEQFCWERD